MVVLDLNIVTVALPHIQFAPISRCTSLQVMTMRLGCGRHRSARGCP